jgi:hypothetical protein
VEHLPGEVAPQIVESLTKLAPAILFSAAIPGQCGTGHVNEQWPQYWVRLFAKLGYRSFDIIRPVIWNDPEVEFWYAQNVFVAARPEYVSTLPALGAASDPVDMLHPQLWKKRLSLPLAEGQAAGVRDLLKELPGAIAKAIERRFFKTRGEDERK